MQNSWKDSSRPSSTASLRSTASGSHRAVPPADPMAESAAELPPPSEAGQPVGPTWQEAVPEAGVASSSCKAGVADAAAAAAASEAAAVAGTGTDEPSAAAAAGQLRGLAASCYLFER